MPTTWPSARTCCALLHLCLLAPPSHVSARRIAGEVTLGPGQATVISKFCFDFNPQCHDHQACLEPPGELDLTVFSAHEAPRRRFREHLVEAREPKVTVALLDDEYFSFPEVSQVWGEANCSDVAKAAKKTFPLEWHRIASVAGQAMKTNVVEKIRPRWWYIALASCSDHALTLSFGVMTSNPLQGANAQLSMDEIGILPVCSMALLGFGSLCAIHLKLVASEMGGACSGGHQGRFFPLIG
ncbi:unnamed protein product [Durusdinium trenchii]|uniref:Uncharacterized protein n=1 Tax=Durusdinium trenchii TaxID=1381693 RepID=A0ABP0LTK3_9DINO